MNIVDKWFADVCRVPVTSFNMLIPNAKVLLDAEECMVYADHCEQSGYPALALQWRAWARLKLVDDGARQ